jgi:hypothetical protein
MPTTTVSLNSITFDVDPEIYDPFGGRRRGTVLGTIDGETIYQDRGLNPSDLRINLSGELYNKATVLALWALYIAAPASGYAFEDFMGNHFTVVFLPGEESFKLSPIYGSMHGWKYQLRLGVLSTVHLLTTSIPPIKPT